MFLKRALFEKNILPFNEKEILAQLLVFILTALRVNI
jgi:hypothetical protein